MQKLNVAGRVLNLKYGLGLEMFNFRYKNDISYNNNPDYIFRDSIDFSKNKLYVGYATIPFMININPTPRSHHGFSLSAGVSAGYKIGSHTKQVSENVERLKITAILILIPGALPMLRNLVWALCIYMAATALNQCLKML